MHSNVFSVAGASQNEYKTKFPHFLLWRPRLHNMPLLSSLPLKATSVEDVNRVLKQAADQHESPERAEWRRHAIDFLRVLLSLISVIAHGTKFEHCMCDEHQM